MIFYENTYDVVALGLTHPGYLFVYTKYWKHGGFLIFITDKLYMFASCVPIENSRWLLQIWYY